MRPFPEERAKDNRVPGASLPSPARDGRSAHLAELAAQGALSLHVANVLPSSRAAEAHQALRGVRRPVGWC